VLVQAQPALPLRVQPPQLLREVGADCAGNRREVDRQPVSPHHAEHLEQPVVVPSCVIVAKEELDRRGRLVECLE
jgi:hypothetical protein